MILASSSPQRKELIKYITSDAVLLSVDTDESFDANLNIYENIIEVAKNKALAVIEKHKIDNDMVIGADTVVSSNGQVLLKPKSYDEAFKMIKGYSENDTEIISGVCIVIIKNGNISIKTFTESSFVRFKNLTDEKIKEWLSKDDYLGCSGAIKIEKVEKIFDLEIEGSVSNIIGLPVEKLSHEIFYLSDSRFKELYRDNLKNKNIRIRSASRVLPMEGDKIFFSRQKNNDGDLGYALIGGGCSIEEDLIIGGMREVEEEAGFIVENLTPIGSAIILNERSEKSQNKRLDGLGDVAYYHYICYGNIIEKKEHHRLDYELDMIDSIVGFEIDEAIELFKKQNKQWKNATNDFFYKFNIGVIEALEELKKIKSNLK